MKALDRVFGKRTLREYYDAGGEALAIIEMAGPRKKKEAIGKLAEMLGIKGRIIEDAIRFHRTSDEVMVKRAEELGANWTDIRRYMDELAKRKTKPSEDNLESFEEIRQERREKERKRKQEAALKKQ